MTRGLIVSCLMAGVMLVALTAPAAAGGWAVTTLDEAPRDLEAGVTYSAGYTILQHGQHPVAVDDTIIWIRSVETGRELTFPGKATGPEGHYVAEVTFPRTGEWAWEVVQGIFGSQALGAVMVQDGAPAASSTASNGTSVTEIARIALPAVAVLMVLLFAVQLGMFVRRRGRGVPTGSGLAGSSTSGD